MDRLPDLTCREMHRLTAREDVIDDEGCQAARGTTCRHPTGPFPRPSDIADALNRSIGALAQDRLVEAGSMILASLPPPNRSSDTPDHRFG